MIVLSSNIRSEFVNKHFNILLLLIFTSITSVSQTYAPDSRRIENTLKKVFTESKREGKSTSNWVACNRDSQYQKNDTIRLISNINGHINDCCEVVDWFFSKKHKLFITESQRCKGSSRIATVRDMYTMSVIQKKAFADIKLKGYDKKIIVFTVLSIDTAKGYNGPVTTMTIKRVYESGSTNQ